MNKDCVFIGAVVATIVSRHFIVAGPRGLLFKRLTIHAFKDLNQMPIDYIIAWKIHELS